MIRITASRRTYAYCRESLWMCGAVQARKWRNRCRLCWMRRWYRRRRRMRVRVIGRICRGWGLCRIVMVLCTSSTTWWTMKISRLSKTINYSHSKEANERRNPKSILEAKPVILACRTSEGLRKISAGLVPTLYKLGIIMTLFSRFRRVVLVRKSRRCKVLGMVTTLLMSLTSCPWAMLRNLMMVRITCIDWPRFSWLGRKWVR